MGRGRAHGAEERGEDFVEVPHERGEDAGIGRAVRTERSGNIVDTVADGDGAPTVEGVGEGELGCQQPHAVAGEVDLNQRR